MKKITAAAVLASVLTALTGCSEADTASQNISNDADNFKISRRIVFYNGVTGGYMLAIEGLCSINDDGQQLEVTCKVKGGYKKHFLGLSDNVTYFAEQIDPAKVDPFHYKVTFRPETLIPDINLVTSGGNK